MAHDRLYRRWRLNRRTLLRAGGTGALGLAAAGLVGCGDDDEATPTAGASPTPGEEASPSPSATAVPTISPDEARRGGTYRTAFSGADNHLSPWHPGGQFIFANTTIYEQPWNIHFRGDQYMVMRLAEAVEQPDEVTYVVNLREARFHDRPPANGRAVTADDVKATYEAIVGDKTAFSRAYYKAAIADVTVVDERTLRVTTKGPSAYFFEQFPRAVLPREMHEKDLREQDPVGSGPWQFKLHTPGSHIEVERFDNYWEEPYPYIDVVRTTLIADEAAKEAAFRSGQLSVFSPTNVRTYERLLSDMGDRVYGVEDFDTRGVAFTFNPTLPPFDDIRVREAIHRALDRQQLVDIVEFGAAEPSAFIGPAYGIFRLPDEELAPYLEHDLDRAKRLLQEAGFPFEREFEMIVRTDQPTWVALAPIIQSQLNAAGIKVKITELAQAEYQQRVSTEQGDYDFAIIPSHPGIPQLLREQHTESNLFRKAMALNDPELDALIEATEREVDTEKRIELYKEFQRKLLPKWPGGFPLYHPKLYLVFQSYVKDFIQYRPVYQPQIWLDL